MAYEKTVWVNGQAPALDADHLNKIEQGIADAVSVTPQTLSDEQKEQVRTNINAAPGGFGWGEEVPRRVSTAAEVDAITANSVVRYANDSANLVDGDSGSYTRYAIVVTYTVNATDKAQDVYCYGGGAHGDVMLHRGRSGNTWLPWEWVNPPMLLGVEYRTTERYLGKPVYVKAVDCGAVPSNTQKIISMGVSGFITKIRCNAFATNSADVFTIPRKVNATEVTVTLASFANNIYISSNTDTLGNYNVYTIMYYTKGMD